MGVPGISRDRGVLQGRNQDILCLGVMILNSGSLVQDITLSWIVSSDDAL